MIGVDPAFTNGFATLYHADALALPLADRSVHCAVTSPPYWGLRDYGIGGWGPGGDPGCDHLQARAGSNTATLEGTPVGHAHEPWPNGVCGRCGATQAAGGIGLEPTLDEWLANIVDVGREVRRVLRDDGTWWLNLGDSYANSSVGGGSPDGPRRGRANMRAYLEQVALRMHLPPKNLIGQPWRAAFALQDDGWILRSAIVWSKPNPMPESVRDRPTNAYEMVFLLTKRPTYYYDGVAIRTPARQAGDYKSPAGWDTSTGAGGHGSFHRQGREKGRRRSDKQRGHSRRHAGFNDRWDGMSKVEQQGNGANARNVWEIVTQGRPEAHFATFPDELARRCILASTSEYGVCGRCGAPWERVPPATDRSSWHGDFGARAPERRDGPGKGSSRNHAPKAVTAAAVEWIPTCEHEGAPRVPATVLDPFVGSGTTCAVAQTLGRRSVGVDLNPEYLDIAVKRLADIPLPMRIW